MSCRAAYVFTAVLALLSASCSPASSDAPLRSPTRDYPGPPPTTSDGEVIGADEVPPGDRLEEGARGGNESALSPGWKADEKGLRYDPKQRAGGAIDNTPPKER